MISTFNLASCRATDGGGACESAPVGFVEDVLDGGERRRRRCGHSGNHGAQKQTSNHETSWEIHARTGMAKRVLLPTSVYRRRLRPKGFEMLFSRRQAAVFHLVAGNCEWL
jgi:hypothetical protein